MARIEFGDAALASRDFLIGALTNTFGRMVGDEQQGWSLFGAMVVLFAVGLGVIYSAEASGNPHFAALDIDQLAGPLQAGGNMEGKEGRFGMPGRRFLRTSPRRRRTAP